MDRRAHEEVYGSCFLIFENHHPGEDPEREAREEREPALAAVAEVLGESGGAPSCQRSAGEKRDLPSASSSSPSRGSIRTPDLRHRAKSGPYYRGHSPLSKNTCK
jgi:hypothetical protein